MKSIIGILLVCFLSVSSSAQKKIDTWKLVFLGGQSNMEGFGKTDELNDTFKRDYQDIFIFHGNDVQDGEENGGVGSWEELVPGHGHGFKSDGQKNYHSDRFGIELSLAKRLRELYPNEKIAIIKYARGGSKLDTIGGHGKYGFWAPGYKGLKSKNQTDYFLSTIRNAFSQKDINNDGIEDKLSPYGICWFQGESDADTKEMATNYYGNLCTMMEIIRAALHDKNIPIVLGKISDSNRGRYRKRWKYGDLVQYAQEEFVRNDVFSEIIRETKHYSYSDANHYDSKGYVDLGIRFANELYLINEKVKFRRNLPKTKLQIP